MSSPDPSNASEAEQDPLPLQASLAQAVEQAAQEDDDTSHGRGK